MVDRGQAHTLEAFAASLLLVGAILFALQVTAVTPLTASTSSQHLENQQARLAGGLLDSAVANGSLTPALLNWNESGGKFVGSTEDGYYPSGGPPDTTFGRMLNRTFRDRGIAFNVNVYYVTSGGDVRRHRMVYFGTPSDHAASARRTVTLNDDAALTSDVDLTVAESSSYFANDIADSGVYNVLRVEVVVWRM